MQQIPVHSLKNYVVWSKHSLNTISQPSGQILSISASESLINKWTWDSDEFIYIGIQITSNTNTGNQPKPYIHICTVGLVLTDLPCSVWLCAITCGSVNKEPLFQFHFVQLKDMQVISSWFPENAASCPSLTSAVLYHNNSSFVFSSNPPLLQNKNHFFFLVKIYLGRLN